MEATTVLREKRTTAVPIWGLEKAYWLLCISSLMIKCFYYQFTTQLNVRPFLSAVNIYMMVSTIGMLLIISGITMLFANKRRNEAFFVMNFLITVLLVADTNFFRYYYGILTIPVVAQFDLELLGTVNDSIMSLFKVNDLIFILDLPMLVAGLVMLKKKSIERIDLKRKVKMVLVFFIAGLSLFSVAYFKTDVNRFVYNNNYVSKRLGVLYAHINSSRLYIRDNYLSSKALTKKDKMILENFYAQKSPSGSEFHGIARGKNLIVVQLEAIQQFVINLEVEGREVTPNLNRLISESLYFDNFYYQIAGGNTSDAELLCNTSLYPAREGAAFYRFAQNTYHSLPKILNQLGYKTYAMHAFTAEFWNRTEMYKTLGFDEFVDGDWYVADDFAGWNGEALSDASFFRQSIEKFDTDTPFYAFMITLSSHHPFSAFEDYDFYTGEFEDTYIGNYLKAANYADKCLGDFIEDLRKRGLLDNTLLVVYGDHSAVPKYLAGQLMDLLNIRYSELEWVKLQKVPCIIRYPGLKNGEKISTTGGEIDLLPTIANLMGFEAPYALGKDLLNTREGYAVLRNGTVITDDYVFINDIGEVFDVSTGMVLNKKYYQKEISQYLNQLVVSDLILEKNAFKYWVLAK